MGFNNFFEWERFSDMRAYIPVIYQCPDLVEVLSIRFNKHELSFNVVLVGLLLLWFAGSDTNTPPSVRTSNDLVSVSPPTGSITTSTGSNTSSKFSSR